ncbi:MAG TPA: M20/M25/M40 family metallo-hydrolase [Thermoanaerobaculia bacterium]
MRRVLAIAVPLLLTLSLAVWRSHGPPPAPANAPADQFSAERASDLLRGLVAEEIPHPIGSPQNQLVRSRIESQFQALGYRTTIQRRFACNWSAVCGTVVNLIARPPGADGSRSVLLMAHYDSVPAGPGASDDAMGVAALLEVARALRGFEARNDIAFLITDGEEAGLLGAEAFVADEALAKSVGVVINVENRGTWGASNLFETSRGNQWIIGNLAGRLPRPQGSSLFYEIYNLLPNDTDLTVFKREGISGVNFAAIRGVNWYHTPMDDLSHASLRTLQHHGENLLASARALAEADLGATTTADATHFDLLGFFHVWWPQNWTLWISIVSLLALVWAIRPGRLPAGREAVQGSRRGLQPISFGVLTAFTILLLAAAGGAALGWLARIGSGGVTWAAWPQPAIASMWLIGLAAAIGGAALFRRRTTPLEMLYGIAITWHAIAIVLAMTIPGASYLFLVPALAVSICALSRGGELVTGAVATTVASVLLFPLALLLYEALGSPMMAVVAVIVALLAMLAAPLMSQPRLAVVAASLGLVAAATAAILPAYSAERPRFTSISWIDDEAAETPRWVTSVASEEMKGVATFAPADPALTPWSRTSVLAAPAPPETFERVELSAERSDDRMRIRVQSRRGAGRVVLLFRGGALVSVNGARPSAIPERRSKRSLNGWESAVVQTGGWMTVEIETTGVVEAVASDVSFGLPESGSPLQKARDRSNAIPIHDGDTTITRSRGRWEP